MNVSMLMRLSFFVFVSSLTYTAFGAKLARGPYLQVGTHESMIIRWRTDVETDSVVKYGTDQGNLNLSAKNNAPTTEHEVKLTGLTPDTKYFYSVGTSSDVIAGNNADCFFITNPTIGTAKPTRIWAIGDAGTGGKPGSDQARVRDAYEKYTGTRHTDLWLQLGDNAYANGSDEQYQERSFEVYPKLYQTSVCWPTMGNHEASYERDALGGDMKKPRVIIPHFLIFTLPTNGEAGGVASGTEKYYSFDYGNIHLICLDSQTDGECRSGSAMATWLKNDLAATKAKWIIAFFHHPPFSRGSNGDHKELRKFILPILEENGVDLVLAGHSHSYERSFFLNGFYADAQNFDLSKYVKIPGSGKEDDTGVYKKALGPNGGTVYVVAGSSGQISKKGTLDHPVMYYSQYALGSLVIDIDGNNRLDAKFLDDAGVIKDYFSIVKNAK